MSIQSAIIKSWLESDIARCRRQINSIILSEWAYRELKEEFYGILRLPEETPQAGLAMTLPGVHEIVDVYFAPLFGGIAFCERVELEEPSRASEKGG
jgi:hypothetical protein